MASTNQSPAYQTAEKKFLEAQTEKERVTYLEEMIRECPKHKSAEKMLAQLKTRLKKLKEKIKHAKKSGKSSKGRIKKAGQQCVLIGLTNSGKSSLLAKLTNAQPSINEYNFTTTKPEIGTLNHGGVNFQIIDLPSIGSENFDIGIANTTDLILIVVDKFEEIAQIKEYLKKAHGKQLIVFNKIDLIEEKRKIFEKLRSKKYNFVLVSAKTNEGIDELKEKILESFDIARIYLKDGKIASDKPLIVKPGTTLEKVAEKISHSFAKTIKEVRIWGPSSKFPNQKVGLAHQVKDKDIVEFKTH